MSSENSSNVRVLASPSSWIESSAVDQCHAVAALPGMESVAAMADLHPRQGGSDRVRGPVAHPLPPPRRLRHRLWGRRLATHREEGRPRADGSSHRRPRCRDRRRRSHPRRPRPTDLGPPPSRSRHDWPGQPLRRDRSRRGGRRCNRLEIARRVAHSLHGRLGAPLLDHEHNSVDVRSGRFLHRKGQRRAMLDWVLVAGTRGTRSFIVRGNPVRTETP